MQKNRNAVISKYHKKMNSQKTGPKTFCILNKIKQLNITVPFSGCLQVNIVQCSIAKPLHWVENQ